MFVCLFATGLTSTGASPPPPKKRPQSRVIFMSILIVPYKCAIGSKHELKYAIALKYAME